MHCRVPFWNIRLRIGRDLPEGVPHEGETTQARYVINAVLQATYPRAGGAAPRKTAGILGDGDERGGVGRKFTEITVTVLSRSDLAGTCPKVSPTCRNQQRHARPPRTIFWGPKNKSNHWDTGATDNGTRGRMSARWKRLLQIKPLDQSHSYFS